MSWMCWSLNEVISGPFPTGAAACEGTWLQEHFWGAGEKRLGRLRGETAAGCASMQSAGAQPLCSSRGLWHTVGAETAWAAGQKATLHGGEPSALPPETLGRSLCPIQRNQLLRSWEEDCTFLVSTLSLLVTWCITSCIVSLATQVVTCWSWRQIWFYSLLFMCIHFSITGTLWWLCWFCRKWAAFWTSSGTTWPPTSMSWRVRFKNDSSSISSCRSWSPTSQLAPVGWTASWSRSLTAERRGYKARNVFCRSVDVFDKDFSEWIIPALRMNQMIGS